MKKSTRTRKNARRASLSRDITTRERWEMRGQLKRAGYKLPGAYASRLSREGSGPSELSHRLRSAPAGWGSLEYTHGYKLKSNSGWSTRDVERMRQKALDDAMALELIRLEQARLKKNGKRMKIKTNGNAASKVERLSLAYRTTKDPARKKALYKKWRVAVAARDGNNRMGASIPAHTLKRNPRVRPYTPAQLEIARGVHSEARGLPASKRARLYEIYGKAIHKSLKRGDAGRGYRQDRQDIRAKREGLRRALSPNMTKREWDLQTKVNFGGRMASDEAASYYESRGLPSHKRRYKLSGIPFEDRDRLAEKAAELRWGRKRGLSKSWHYTKYGSHARHQKDYRKGKGLPLLLLGHDRVSPIPNGKRLRANLTKREFDKQSKRNYMGPLDATKRYNYRGKRHKGGGIDYLADRAAGGDWYPSHHATYTRAFRAARTSTDPHSRELVRHGHYMFGTPIPNPRVREFTARERVHALGVYSAGREFPVDRLRREIEYTERQLKESAKKRGTGWQAARQQLRARRIGLGNALVEKNPRVRPFTASERKIAASSYFGAKSIGASHSHGQLKHLAGRIKASKGRSKSASEYRQALRAARLGHANYLTELTPNMKKSTKRKKARQADKGRRDTSRVEQIRARYGKYSR